MARFAPNARPRLSVARLRTNDLPRRVTFRASDAARRKSVAGVWHNLSIVQDASRIMTDVPGSTVHHPRKRLRTTLRDRHALATLACAADE
jgi:hypothetical protein